MHLLRGFRHYLPKGRRQRAEQGFSLVETLAALIVFGLITLGLIPLLAASIRGSNTSRTATVGKNLVVEAVERVRGYPFYISYGTQARKVDVLDLFYPGRTPTFGGGTCTGYLGTGSATCTSTSYTATGPSYVTTCPNATNIACPLNIPSNYTLTFDVSFVDPTAAAPETYSRQTPDPAYTYASTSGDRPRTLLVQLTVTARWTAPGRGPRTYQVRTLLSDRQFSGLKVLGDATVDYGAQIITGYPAIGSDNETELIATAGHSVSHIETRRAASASALVRGGEITLIDLILAQDDIEGNEYYDSTPRLGVEETVVAPPDATVNPTSVANPAVVNHPNNSYNMVAQLDTTDADEVSATTTGALPAAEADFDFSPSSSEEILVANARADNAGNDLNLEDPEDWVARVITNASDAMEGGTSATTNALGAQPGVTASAAMEFAELHLFNTDFIDDVDNRFDGAVIAITGPESGGNPTGLFSASANCNANNDGTTHATAAQGTYSGTLWYWRDPTENNDDGDGSYVSVNLTPGSDVLAPIMNGTPVLVYDTNPDTQDVYLFDEGGNYYLESWGNLAGATTSVTNGGRVTQASMENAVSIETGPLQRSTNPETALSVAIGSVNCRAEDYR